MARQQPAQRRALQINDVVEDVLDMMAPVLRAKQIGLNVNLMDDWPLVYGDSDQLHQVLSNLIRNAEHAVKNEKMKRIVISTTKRNLYVELRVQDSGHGIPEAIREQIFEPFFTTKEEGHGTGLGLSVCAGIIEGHGGKLSVQEVMKGACFVIHLPLMQR